MQAGNCPGLLAKLQSRRFALGAPSLPSFQTNICRSPIRQAWSRVFKKKGTPLASRNLQQVEAAHTGKHNAKQVWHVLGAQEHLKWASEDGRAVSSGDSTSKGEKAGKIPGQPVTSNR